jgi:hypothetical protein
VLEEVQVEALQALADERVGHRDQRRQGEDEGAVSRGSWRPGCGPRAAALHDADVTAMATTNSRAANTVATTGLPLATV